MLFNENRIFFLIFSQRIKNQMVQEDIFTAKLFIGVCFHSCFRHFVWKCYLRFS